jgi:hypothetical protein
MATVSVLGSEKMNVYLFAPPDSTFIVSAGNWDREESSFHLPANGSSAAREVPVTMQTAISSCNVRFNIPSSLQGEDSDRRAHRYRPARAVRIAREARERPCGMATERLLKTSI